MGPYKGDVFLRRHPPCEKPPRLDDIVGETSAAPPPSVGSVLEGTPPPPWLGLHWTLGARLFFVSVVEVLVVVVVGALPFPPGSEASTPSPTFMNYEAEQSRSPILKRHNPRLETTAQRLEGTTALGTQRYRVLDHSVPNEHEC